MTRMLQTRKRGTEYQLWGGAPSDEQIDQALAVVVSDAVAGWWRAMAGPESMTGKGKESLLERLALVTLYGRRVVDFELDGSGDVASMVVEQVA